MIAFLTMESETVYKVSLSYLVWGNRKGCTCIHGCYYLFNSLGALENHWLVTRLKVDGNNWIFYIKIYLRCQ